MATASTQLRSAVSLSPSSQPDTSLPASPTKKLTKEIYTYHAPWPVNAIDWSKKHHGKNQMRLAVGSFLEENSNKIQILELSEADIEYQEEETTDFRVVAEESYQYPVTKVIWAPDKGGSQAPDLLATTGDCLRLWEVEEEIPDTSATVGETYSRTGNLTLRACLKNNKSDQKFCAPLTSFDWNEVDPSLIVTSSIDTTCTLWNVETMQAKTQLIAHDKEVYDVAFASGSADVFASVGADGSVRMFDLRSLEHSTIIYETPSTVPPPSSGAIASAAPVLRLAFNRLDPNYLTTFHADSTSVPILDVRVPGVPVTELNGHNAPVNCMGWAPHSSGHLCTGGDDAQVLVWDLHQMARGRYVQDAILAYNAGEEVNELTWSSTSPEWVAITFEKTVQALRV